MPNNNKLSPGCTCCGTGFTISGSVHSVCSNNPMTGIQVDLCNSSGTPLGPTTTTDGSGNFQFTGLSNGTYRMRINNSTLMRFSSITPSGITTVAGSNVTTNGSPFKPPLASGKLCCPGIDYGIPNQLHISTSFSAGSVLMTSGFGSGSGPMGASVPQFSYTGPTCNSGPVETLADTFNFDPCALILDIRYIACSVGVLACYPWQTGGSAATKITVSTASVTGFTQCGSCSISLTCSTSTPPYSASGTCGPYLALGTITITE
jgi:hypothetical protein